MAPRQRTTIDGDGWDMISARYEAMVFGLILSGLMSCLVSGISTVRATGLVDDVFGLWMQAWITSWLVAFPAVLVVAPLTRRIVRRLIRD